MKKGWRLHNAIGQICIKNVFSKVVCHVWHCRIPQYCSKEQASSHLIATLTHLQPIAVAPTHLRQSLRVLDKIFMPSFRKIKRIKPVYVTINMLRLIVSNITCKRLYEINNKQVQF